MILLLILFVSAFIFFFYMGRRPPHIDELSALLAKPGDRVEISGCLFGDTHTLSDVYFNDRPLNLSLVEEWRSNAIKIVVPSFSNSALVRVETEYGMSNAMILYNEDDFPQFSLTPFLPELPYIEYIDPSEGGCGTLVTIKGSNFGENRKSSRIIVNGKEDNHPAFFDIPDERNYIILNDGDYKSWSMKEISFYIPEGVESGFLYISTDRGYSNPIYFDVTQRSGRKELGRSVTIQFEQEAIIDRVGAWANNTLFLWLSKPSPSWRQKGITLLGENGLPYLERDNLSLYALEEIRSGEEYRISRQFLLTAYDSRVIWDDAVSPIPYDRERGLYKEYSSATGEYPANDRTLRNRAALGAAGYRNLYMIARSLNSYLVNRLSFQEEPVQGEVLEVIDGRKGNVRDYVRALITLLRASGIPAREVRGILLTGEEYQPVPHSWVEIYFERLGWFPVDPVLADNPNLLDDARYDGDYFWGGLTHRHIAFSRGIETCPALDDEGVVKNVPLYSKQTIHEEAQGNISFYRSRWPLPAPLVITPGL